MIFKDYIFHIHNHSINHFNFCNGLINVNTEITIEFISSCSIISAVGKCFFGKKFSKAVFPVGL